MLGHRKKNVLSWVSSHGFEVLAGLLGVQLGGGCHADIGTGGQAGTGRRRRGPGGPELSTWGLHVAQKASYARRCFPPNRHEPSPHPQLRPAHLDEPARLFSLVG